MSGLDVAYRSGEWVNVPISADAVRAVERSETYVRRVCDHGVVSCARPDRYRAGFFVSSKSLYSLCMEFNMCSSECV